MSREKTEMELFYENRIEALQNEIKRLNSALVFSTSQIDYLQFTIEKAKEKSDEIALTQPDFIFSTEKLIKNFLD